MACAEGGVLMACAAYMIWHVHGPGQGARRAACARTRSWAWRPRHVIGPRTRTNPPGGKWGWRQAPPSAIPSDSSHLEGHGLAPASSKSVAMHTLPPQIPAPLHEQSGAPALFALSESPVDRMAPSPFDITSAAVQPMDCRRSEVPIVLQSKTLSGNTAIRRQNVIN